MKKIFFMLFATLFFWFFAVDQSIANTESIACELAARLPKDASAEARRIACNIPSDLQIQVNDAELIGIQLRKHDLAGWITSDALRIGGIFKSIPGEAKGWLAVESEQSIIVRYYVKADNGIFVFAEATMGLRSFKSDRGIKYVPMRKASTQELALLQARDLAINTKQLNCSEAFKSVVLPFKQADREEIRVYLFSPWTDTKAPIGGHHLIRFKPDGKEIIDQFSLTPTCLNYDARLLSNTTSFTVTHNTSVAPTEMDVFLSLQYRKPIFITTTANGITWKVDINQIHVVSRADSKKPNEPSTMSVRNLTQEITQ
jgi:hypothetical protein